MTTYNISQIIERNKPKEINFAIKLLYTVIDENLFNEMIHSTKNVVSNSNKHRALKNGFFTSIDFLSFLTKFDNNGIDGNIAGIILQKFISLHFVSDSSFLHTSSFFRYKWNKERINSYNELGIIENAIFGVNYIIEKYSRSVPAIIVNKFGIERIVTGFLATTHQKSTKIFVVTARHNVDTEDGITFCRLRSDYLMYTPLRDKWLCHDNIDLAIMPVSLDGEATALLPIGRPDILDRTITMGYPQIATTNDAYMLTHSGEINAIVKNYQNDELIIVSNRVSPGSSGGPVIDECGLCLGMIINSLETSHEGGVSKANAALPARMIFDFIVANS